MNEMKSDQRYMLYIDKVQRNIEVNDDNNRIKSCCIIADFTGGYERNMIDKMTVFEELFYKGFNGSVYILINDMISYIKSSEARAIFNTIHYMKRGDINHDFDITFLDSSRSTGITILNPYNKYIYYNTSSDIIIDEIVHDYPTSHIISADAESATRAE